MRRLFTFAIVLALTACGGGGGGGSTTPVATPTTAPTTSPASNLVTPQFSLRIPAPGSKTSSTKRSPKYISPSTLSVKITLTSDSAGINPTSITGNPATTSIPAGTCTAGCTVPGPPSPPGSDTFTITTYDTSTGTGNALSTATTTVTIVAGTANSNAVTLNGIVASIAIAGVPATNAFAAGTPNSSNLTVTASDADGNTITGTYNNAITVSDPDTLSDGSSVAATTCPAQGTETTVAASSVSFTSDTSTAKFCYNGIAENPVTLTASATGATGGTASFQPLLSAPAYVTASGTPAGVVSPTTGEIDLFAPSGLGSTGSVNFAETGWTTAPFNQLLGAAATAPCSSGGPLSTFATLSTAAATGATTITATAASPETPGFCTVYVSDGLTANTSDTTGLFNVSYTSTSIPVNGHRRQTH